jgi:hypothetical protein
MVNLAFKVAIVSSFVTAVVLHDGGADRPLAASESAISAATTPAQEAPATEAPHIASQPPVKAAAVSPNPTNPALLGEIPETSQDVAASAFSAEVLRLSAEADQVDGLWLAYKQTCGVRISRHYDFGREWFSIWDRAAEATVDSPVCSEGLRHVRQAGEIVGREILKARATARQGLLNRGTEVGMLRWNALQWPQFEEDGARRPSRAAASSLPPPVRYADAPAGGGRSGPRPRRSPEGTILQSFARRGAR